MTDLSQVHAEQVAYWNGVAGERWAAQQAQTDAMLAPVATAAIEHAAPQADARVLDIGCGCGGTTLALAVRLPRGHVTGLDVSAPMLAVAQRRGEAVRNVAWLCADAAHAVFPPGGFDLLFSRFGVMFFGDPVAAFTNLRRATRSGGRLVFACWRALAENPWMQLPLVAAMAHLPPLPEPGPDDPGPFAFADRARVARILREAGWTDPRFTAVDVSIDIADGHGLAAAVQQATVIGAAARALRDQPDAARAAAVAAIRDALAPLAGSDGRVMLGGAVWLVASENA